MKETIYYRRGRTISTPNGDTTYKFINQAKRESRKLQLAKDGALGRGSLEVIK